MTKQAAALKPVPARPMPVSTFGLLQPCAAPGCGRAIVRADHRRSPQVATWLLMRPRTRALVRGTLVAPPVRLVQACGWGAPRTDPQQDRHP